MLKSGPAKPLSYASQTPLQVPIMKIDSTTPSPASLAKTRQQRPANAVPARDATSDTSINLSVANALASEPPGAPIDSQRIAEIRQSIAEGKLQINPERIADRLLEAAREQLAKNRGS